MSYHQATETRPIIYHAAPIATTRAGQPPPSLTPHAPAREGHDPLPSPTVQPDRPARSPGPETPGRIARPSAGCGSHLARTRDRGPGGFPPPGGLGPIGRAGGPGQRLIQVLYNKISGLEEIQRRVPKGAFGRERLRPRRS